MRECPRKQFVKDGTVPQFGCRRHLVSTLGFKALPDNWDRQLVHVVDLDGRPCFGPGPNAVFQRRAYRAEHPPEAADLAVVAVLGLYVTKVPAEFLHGFGYGNPAARRVAGRSDDAVLVLVKVQTGFKDPGPVAGDSEVGGFQGLENLLAVAVVFRIPYLFAAALVQVCHDRPPQTIDTITVSI